MHFPPLIVAASALLVVEALANESQGLSITTSTTTLTTTVLVTVTGTISLSSKSDSPVPVDKHVSMSPDSSTSSPAQTTAALQLPQTTTSTGKTISAVTTSSVQLIPLHKPNATVSLEGPQDVTATISGYAATSSSLTKAGESNAGARVGGASMALVVAVAGFAMVLVMM